MIYLLSGAAKPKRRYCDVWGVFALYAFWTSLRFRRGATKFISGTMSKKRRREQPNADTRLIEIYEDLANENEEVRLKAAQSLLSRFTPESNTTNEEVVKALKRLIRGLCSGRKAARLGFSVAFTELLVQLLGPSRKDVSGLDLSISELIELLKEQTHIGGNVSGQVSQFMRSLPMYRVLTWVSPRKNETITSAAFLVQKRSSNLAFFSDLEYLQTTGIQFSTLYLS